MASVNVQWIIVIAVFVGWPLVGASPNVGAETLVQNASDGVVNAGDVHSGDDQPGDREPGNDQHGNDQPGDPARGYFLLLNQPYVPPYFDQETFEQVWRVWPEPLRSQAEGGSPEVRRRLAFKRYGLTERPDASDGLPLQFVVDQRGEWSPNCFTCHGGELLGRPVPGRPNARYALKTLIEETRATKSLLEKPWTQLDVGAYLIELGSTHGTTNAVIFGVALGDRRDADLNVVPRRGLPRYVHHDMDAPPWWYYHRKHRLYLEGFAVKAHRPLMQFALDPENSPAQLRAWEQDFKDISAYLETLRPPPYPFAVDDPLAETGRTVFAAHCAECHGSYGGDGVYEERVVPWDEIGTDTARREALTDKHRESFARNWLSHYGEDDVRISPGGYVAPPLDGIWASAPYLHNGSVPTLWHLLHPDHRPVVWRRNSDDYDRHHVGIHVESLAIIPAEEQDKWTRRSYFDTRVFGKSAAGHRFPDALTESEKAAVLEYLKTL